MMMFGWLFLLVIIGIPILVVAYLLGRKDIFQQNRPTTVIPPENRSAEISPPLSADPATPAPPAAAAIYCSHCGASLQPEWTHCPQCGAPVD